MEEYQMARFTRLIPGVLQTLVWWGNQGSTDPAHQDSPQQRLKDQLLLLLARQPQASTQMAERPCPPTHSSPTKIFSIQSLWGRMEIGDSYHLGLGPTMHGTAHYQAETIPPRLLWSRHFRLLFLPKPPYHFASGDPPRSFPLSPGS